MSATYDLSTNVGKCRLHAADTNTADVIFSDEEYAVFLDQAGDNVLLAAALACDAMATDAAKMAIAMKTDTTNTDLKGVAEQLAARAKALRAQVVMALVVSSYDQMFSNTDDSGLTPGSMTVW